MSERRRAITAISLGLLLGAILMRLARGRSRSRS
jgi:hypothetical protein